MIKIKFREIMYALCVFVMIGSILFIIQDRYIEYKQKEIISNVQEQKSKEEERTTQEVKEETKIEKELNNTSSTELNEEEVVEEKEIISKYVQIYNENSDCFGWIEIENTNINYPVMYTPSQPNFYINKNFLKEDSEMGSIYINGSNNPIYDSNIIIYGHNRKDLTMFGYLSCYKDESFYLNHKFIRFDTIFEEGKYEIVAVSQAFINPEDLMSTNDINKSKVSFKEVLPNEYLFYNHLKLDTKEEFEEYIRYMKEHSYYEINNEIEYGDKLITLCTCTNIKKYQNERLLVIAKKIE